MGQNGHDHLRDPELLSLCWEHLAQEWQTLKKMCVIAARKDRLRNDTWEEAMSEVVLKLPQILWSYDPSGGRTLKSHVIGSCRWYLFKVFVTARRGRRAQARQAVLEEMARDPDRVAHHDDHGDFLRGDEVQSLLSKVHPLHRSLLELYYMVGLTHEEIAGVLECSKSYARKQVIRALEAARDAALDQD